MTKLRRTKVGMTKPRTRLRMTGAQDYGLVWLPASLDRALSFAFAE